MSDERVRELERRWQETGSDDDEVAWLRQRVRSGQLLDGRSYARLAELDVHSAASYLLARVERGDTEEGTLRLGAYCGHEPAVAALGEAFESGKDVDAWLTGLGSCVQSASIALPWVAHALAAGLLQDHREAFPEDEFTDPLLTEAVRVLSELASTSRSHTDPEALRRLEGALRDLAQRYEDENVYDEGGSGLILGPAPELPAAIAACCELHRRPEHLKPALLLAMEALRTVEAVSRVLMFHASQTWTKPQDD